MTRCLEDEKSETETEREWKKEREDRGGDLRSDKNSSSLFLEPSQVEEMVETEGKEGKDSLNGRDRRFLSITTNKLFTRRQRNPFLWESDLSSLIDQEKVT